MAVEQLYIHNQDNTIWLHTADGETEKMKIWKAALLLNKLSCFCFASLPTATAETLSHEQHFLSPFIEQYGILFFIS
jgi:hypothetical protein